MNLKDYIKPASLNAHLCMAIGFGSGYFCAKVNVSPIEFFGNILVITWIWWGVGRFWGLKRD